MDDDADAKPSQVPPITGHWKATSTYDVYMVDTLKNDEDNPNPDEENPLINHQSTDVSGAAHDCVGRRIVIPASETTRLLTMPKIPNTPSSPRPDRMEGKRVNIPPDTLTTKMQRTATTCQNPKRRLATVTKTSLSLEEPLDQERFKRQLIAIDRSLKRKQQQLKEEQDTLNERWTKVLAAEE